MDRLDSRDIVCCSNYYYSFVCMLKCNLLNDFVKLYRELFLMSIFAVVNVNRERCYSNILSRYCK